MNFIQKIISRIIPLERQRNNIAETAYTAAYEFFASEAAKPSRVRSAKLPAILYGGQHDGKTMDVPQDTHNIDYGGRLYTFANRTEVHSGRWIFSCLLEQEES